MGAAPQPTGGISGYAARINGIQKVLEQERLEVQKRLEQMEKDKNERKKYKAGYEKTLKELGIKIVYSPDFIKEGYELQVFAIDKTSYEVAMQYKTEEGNQQQIVLAEMKLKEHSYEEGCNIMRDLINKTIVFSSKEALDIKNEIIKLEKKGVQLTPDGLAIISSPRIEEQEFIRADYTPRELELRKNPPKEMKSNFIRDSKETILIEGLKRYIMERCKQAEESIKNKKRNNREIEALERVQKKEEEEYILKGVKFNDLTGLGFKRAERKEIQQNELPSEETEKYYRQVIEAIKAIEKQENITNDFTTNFKRITPIAIARANSTPQIGYNLLNDYVGYYLQCIPEAYRDEEYKKYSTYLAIRQEYNTVLQMEGNSEQDSYRKAAIAYQEKLNDFINASESKVALEDFYVKKGMNVKEKKRESEEVEK